MKHLFLFVLLVSSSLVYAQTADEMLLEAMKGEDDLAIGAALDAGADINLQDEQGNTALMWAVEKNKLMLVIFIYQHLNPNINIKNKKNETAKTIAIQNNAEEIIYFLENPEEGLIRFFCLTGNLDMTSLYEKGKYNEALEKALETKKYCLEGYGKEHSSYITSLYNLAELYVDIGRYLEAEPIYLEIINVERKASKDKTQNHVTLLNNLAILYVKIGQYQKAEAFYLQAIDIQKEILEEQDLNFASTFNNLGVLYEIMGNYQKAEKKLMIAINIYEKHSKKEDPDYANVLNNLAGVYEGMNNDIKAMAFYLKAKVIYEKYLRVENSNYAALLNNLGRMYNKIDNYQKAEDFYSQAQDIYKNIVGENHPEYAFSLNSLGVLNKNMGNYKKAEAFLLKALDINKKTLNSKHPQYKSSLNNLAGLYQSMGTYKKTIPYLTESLQIQQYNSRQHTSTLSENAIIKYLKQEYYTQELAHSFNTNHPSPSIILETHNLHLVTKGLALQGHIDTRFAILTKGDKNLVQLYEDWKFLRTQLNHAEQMSIAEQDKKGLDLQVMEEQISDLEQQMSILSAPIKAEFEHRKAQVKYSHLVSELKEGEAAIDFVHFQYYNGKEWTNSTLYAAYIALPNSKQPIFVSLTEERQILALLKDEVGSKREYSYIESTETRQALYQVIFAPLEKHLKGAKTLHISQSGILHQIAFHALFIEKGEEQRLVDTYNIHYQGSLRDFVLNRQKAKTSTNPNRIALFGHPNYGISLAEVAAPAFDLDNTWVHRGSQDGFAPLPETRVEVNQIAQTASVAVWDTLVWQANTASEENFKALSGRQVRIIHIATHGYALAKKQEEMPQHGFSDMLNSERIALEPHPLKRAGLAMAGGNSTWTSDEYPGTGNNGLLTAYEISQMDLRGTDLVVLSACDTGRGDVLSGEGVFGLQRGFRAAGVKHLIVSLWKVDDEATRLLMEKFYKHYFQGKSPHEALETAQEEMRSKGWATKYWAAFVLIE